MTQKQKTILYTPTKIFHFREKIDSLSPDNDRIEPPIHIRIKPTNVCNHSCRYCAYKVDSLQLGKDMIRKDYIPREKMTEILDDISEMGVKSVTFSGGGEPFCYPYLLESVKKLSKTKVKFATLTNGSKLQGELAEIFSHHATWIRISMDGWDDESYSYYRRVPEGEFSGIIRNIENFKKIKGKCFIGVSLIIDNKNAGHIYEFINRIKNAGVNSIKVSPCIVSNTAAENNLYHNPIFEKVKEQIERAVSDFGDDGFEINDSYHKLNEAFENKYTWCPFLQILPVIGADLNVYSCHDKAYNLNSGLMGSIKNQRFKDFWFSDKSNFFKINPSVDCNHHCVANMKNRLILEYLNVDRDHLEFV